MYNIFDERLLSVLSILTSGSVLNYMPPFRSIISKIAKLITRLQWHNASWSRRQIYRYNRQHKDIVIQIPPTSTAIWNSIFNLLNEYGWYIKIFRFLHRTKENNRNICKENSFRFFTFLKIGLCLSCTETCGGFARCVNACYTIDAWAFPLQHQIESLLILSGSAIIYVRGRRREQETMYALGRRNVNKKELPWWWYSVYWATFYAWRAIFLLEMDFAEMRHCIPSFFQFQVIWRKTYNFSHCDPLLTICIEKALYNYAHSIEFK